MIKISREIGPTKILLISLIAVIIIGAFILRLPMCNNQPIKTIDSIFVATSATCVTGHSTVDVESTFTLFGQIVIMLLIQIGGLGFMLVIAIILMWLGKKITLKDRILISQSVSKNDFDGVVKLLKKILKYTFTIELLGALILATRIVPELGFRRRNF